MAQVYAAVLAQTSAPGPSWTNAGARFPAAGQVTLQARPACYAAGRRRLGGGL